MSLTWKIFDILLVIFFIHGSEVCITETLYCLRQGCFRQFYLVIPVSEIVAVSLWFAKGMKTSGPYGVDVPASEGLSGSSMQDCRSQRPAADTAPPRKLGEP
uniref:Uncharacterized protein n=1 Tax=Rhipicephalus appendiculatus TaxID=34631 RepID=A0A131YDP0_RHIAP